MSTVIRNPIENTNTDATFELNETPIAPLTAPTPSGTAGVFKPSDGVNSIRARLAASLAEDGVATVETSKNSAFTRDTAERKNQERVDAFNLGPVFPMGGSASAGANTLQPFVNAFFNRERLNAGTPVRTELGAPFQRSLGNAFGHRVNASNWAAMAAVQTGAANVDPSGFAQVNHTGNFIADRDTSYQPERGWNPGGPVYGFNLDPNAAAAYDRQDGAAGGDAGFAVNTAIQAQGGVGAFSIQPMEGAGSLAVPKAYGLDSGRGGLHI